VNALLVLPVLVPLSTAIACLLLGGRPGPQRAASLAGAAGLLVSGAFLLARAAGGEVLVTRVGSWPAPFGITLVADLLAAIMVLLSGVVGLAVLVFALGTLDAGRESFSFHSFFHVLLAGVCGAFLTGDIFNLFVWFEVLLMASFVLLALGGERAQLEGAVKYVTLNLVASAVFLAAVGLLYGTAGTLNFAALSRAAAGGADARLVTTISTLLLVAFGIKAAVFPLFFWLPASYHTPPVAVTALFAGLLTKVGVYSLLRAFTLVFTGDTAFTHSVLLVVAAFTMAVGVLGAVAQYEVRRLLAFHSVSQVGYMVLGLGLLSPLGLAGSVLFLVHHGLVKSSLFLIGGAARLLGGSYDVRRLGGLWRSHPGLSVLFLLQAFSLAGIPPLSGFWGKLALVKAGLDAREWAVTGVALGVSLLTLFSMTKIWNEAFWKDAPEGAPQGPPRLHALVLGPIVALTLVTLALGLGAGPALDIASRAAGQLADPSAYVAAVLGEGTRP
jgi:multicomponent Na+:H+ antiporter subunit D